MRKMEISINTEIEKSEKIQKQILELKSTITERKKFTREKSRFEQKRNNK
jgi:hypothetical protein